MMKVFLEIKPTCGHRLIECESGEDLTEEEAIEIVKEYWDDMGSSYYTWTLEKVIFHESMPSENVNEEEK